MVFGLSLNPRFGTYSSTSCTSLRSVTFPTSAIAVTSHVPWIVPIFTAVVRKSSNFKRSRDFCRERTLQRLQMGANRKDLFYYLVSFLIEYLTPSAHSKLCGDRAARISLKMSVRLTARLHRTGSWPSSPVRTQPAAFSQLCSIISYAILECMNVCSQRSTPRSPVEKNLWM